MSLITPPLYLAGMKIACWKCGDRMPVVALIAPHAAELEPDAVCILSEITRLPDEVQNYLGKRVTSFKWKITVDDEYYGNTCPHCGALSGDFFLHNEPGAPFFPTSEAEAGRLFITEIPLQGPVDIESAYHAGPGELILAHAKRIE